MVSLAVRKSSVWLILCFFFSCAHKAAERANYTELLMSPFLWCSRYTDISQYIQLILGSRHDSPDSKDLKFKNYIFIVGYKSKECMFFNNATNTWYDVCPSMNMHLNNIVAVNNQIYVFHGKFSEFYSPITNKWVQLKNVPKLRTFSTSSLACPINENIVQVMDGNYGELQLSQYFTFDSHRLFCL